MKIILLSLSIFLTISSNAATNYIRASASGTGSGTDWNNAFTSIPNTLTRGDTYLLAGGSYGTHTFAATAGTTYVNLIHATTNVHGTATGWNDAFATQAVVSASSQVWTLNMANILISGESGSGTNSSTYGIKVITTATTEGSSPIVAWNGAIHNLILKYVELGCPAPNGNMAVRCFDERTDIFGTAVVSTNILLQNCYMHGGLVGITFSGDGVKTQNDIIDHCYLRLFAGQEHSEAIQLASTVGVTIRYSVLEDCVYPCTTYIEPQFSPKNLFVYGNVFRATLPTEGTGNASVMSMTSGEVISTAYFYNNTIYGFHAQAGGFQDTGIGASSAGNNSIDVRAQNNIWQNCVYNPGFDGVTTQDHNILNTGGASFVNPSIGNYHLSANTTAGVNLGAPYNVDGDGVTRTTWSLGAFEFVSAADPSISVQPANQTVISGANASFSVTASGASTLHYQWRKNGSNVGSDSSAFSFATVNSDNLASIVVTVTDNAGSLDSSTATLTVITNPIPFVNPTTLAYGLNPTNTLTNSSFVISNAGGGTLIGSATISAPYSIIAGNNYSLSAGQAQTVTVKYSPILNQTDNGIVNLTGGGSTNVVVSGSGYYVYSPGIIPMAGVTLFSPMQINVQGSIFQTVTTAAINGGQAVVGLRLTSPTTITMTGNVIATNTANNTLAIDIDSDPTAPSQEWSITNLTANVLVSRVVSKRGVGSGSLPQIPTNTWSLASGLHLIELRGIEANTFVNQLTINATNDPSITVQPVNQTVTAGGNATFTVTATGNSTLHYQWIFNGLNVGSDSNSYTRNNCQVADNGGTMVVNVSDASGSVNSQNATLTVNAQILNSGITIQGKFKITGKAKLNQ